MGMSERLSRACGMGRLQSAKRKDDGGTREYEYDYSIDNMLYGQSCPKARAVVLTIHHSSYHIIIAATAMGNHAIMQSNAYTL
jgi:hypothetical protein